MMTLTYYNILKNKLDKFWFHQPVKFDFNEELETETDPSIVTKVYERFY